MPTLLSIILRMFDFKKITKPIAYLKKEKLLVIFIALFTLTKLVFISGENIHVGFDQTRDAIISRTIVENGDIKLQGPSASGTNDQIYHGVMYYYIIGPLYTIFSGNVITVNAALIFITSLGLIPTYLLAQSFFKSRTASFWLLLLIVLNHDQIVTGTWLSNPVLLVITVPSFYYSLWRWWQEKSSVWLSVSLLFLGLSNQAAIFTVYLWLPIILIYGLQSWEKRKIFLIKPLKLLTSISIYMLVISTMIVTQLKMYLNGSLKPELVANLFQSGDSLFSSLVPALKLYIHKLNFLIFPNLGNNASLSIAIFLITFLYMFRKISTKHRAFYLFWLISPMLLLLNFKNSFHGVLGIGTAVLFPVAYLLDSLYKKGKQFRILAAILLTAYISIHLMTLNVKKTTLDYQYAVQRGFMLVNQLSLIDKTYQLAQGEPFSISTLTIPFSWNTTWSYLYHWYGLKTYGYTPKFLGPSQEGIFGSHYLEATKLPLEHHFTIYEPKITIADVLMTEFEQNQNNIGELKHKQDFNKLTLVYRYNVK